MRDPRQVLVIGYALSLLGAASLVAGPLLLAGDLISAEPRDGLLALGIILLLIGVGIALASRPSARRQGRLLSGHGVLGRWQIGAAEWAAFLAEEHGQAADPDSSGNLLASPPYDQGSVAVVVGRDGLQIGRRYFDFRGRQGPAVIGVRDVLGRQKVLEIRVAFPLVSYGMPPGELRFPYPAGQEQVIVQLRERHPDLPWNQKLYQAPIDRWALLLFRTWLIAVLGGAALLVAGLLLRERNQELAQVPAIAAVLGGTLAACLVVFMGPVLLTKAAEIRRQGREQLARRRAKG